jgi:hypothetical protein
VEVEWRWSGGRVEVEWRWSGGGVEMEGEISNIRYSNLNLQ